MLALVRNDTPKPKKVKFYFTFPLKYHHLCDRYLVIEREDDDYWEARTVVTDSIIGNRFAFQYTEHHFKRSSAFSKCREITLAEITEDCFTHHESLEEY